MKIGGLGRRSQSQRILEGSSTRKQRNLRDRSCDGHQAVPTMDQENENALDQIRPYVRNALDVNEKLSEDAVDDMGSSGTIDNRKNMLSALVAHRRDVRMLYRTTQN